MKEKVDRGRKVDIVSGRGIILCEGVLLSTFRERFFGLAWRNPKKVHNPVILFPCNGVHTLFMTFAIDVLFLSKRGEVLKVIRQLPPWRFVKGVPGGRLVIEYPSHFPPIADEKFLHIPGLIEK